MTPKPKVMVSGCFDVIHPGHVTFLTQASSFGELYVSAASDKTIRRLKGHWPLFSEPGRVFHLKAFNCVTDAFIGSGEGLLDFADDMRRLSPDIFVVNDDQDHADKRALCKGRGIEYKVMKRYQNSWPNGSSTVAREYLELVGEGKR
ncbi:MAG: adenylyltransferase/cytidyltransferase family protein [Actinomycetota bacterium]|nr:adenylyltransferase/cytidyltransferase family protein [Actinomycetota bacterium]